MNTKAIIGVDPKLPYAIEEAINRLRINVSFFGTDIRKIMIVSSEPNEGKSFIAMSLWNQIEREDGKDLWGLSHYLSDNKKLEDCILTTDLPDGDILPNANNIVNPSMLLESRRFSELLDILAQRYRYVFMDVPPLGLVSDAERIGHFCDGAILTVRSGETPRSIIRNSISQLERAGCPILGIALNRVGASSGKYYGGYYGRHYGSKYYTDKYYTSK